MRYSRRIEAAIQVFRLDRPEATWAELVGPLRELAEALLWEMVHNDESEALSLEYEEILGDLQDIKSNHPMTVDRLKALKVGIRMVQATQERLLKGNPEPLSDLIEELQVVPSTVPTAVAREEEKAERWTMAQLSSLYMAEMKDQLAPSSIAALESSFKTLAEAAGEMDLKTHTRADMVILKARIGEGRKAITVNKILSRLGALLTWAENNGYIDKAFNKGLKITKGAESGRKAFNDAQLRDLMDYLPGVEAWKRWAVSVGVITGARIGEIGQLTRADIKKVGGEWVIDINAHGEKTLKNKHSERLVPLVDRAYGFNLQEFLGYVESVGNGPIFPGAAYTISTTLNETLRDALGIEPGGGLSFHSLRHSVAGLLKRHEIPVTTAQAILGHSSQTITFDLYGGSSRVAVGKMADALRESFGV
ncbi:site-specific integrase [Pseudomonas sp. RC3H12]|uniref:site-specific integrase n=1 Tax=Pseudomonas sp. RC3H12 TaxID=2834406 RepID=UPI001BDE9840|nr:site-specific integrase [Pseudomonas sp. RC3H12]QWA30697.1 site-specific integrase [Pseudomonas sp. RC3H12]